MAGLAALAAAYMLSQFYRTFLAVLTPELSSGLGMTNTELSIASGAWFAAFAFMQFGIGVSLDRYGPRRTASILLGLGGGGGALLFAVAVQPWMVIAAMTLIGIGCAPVLMASVFIFARSFSPARLAILTSWLIGLGSAGNVLGASPLAAATEAFGWREVMAAMAVLTLIVAALIQLLLRDPERLPEDGNGRAGFGGYLDLLKIRTLWLLLPLIAINYAPSVGIRGLWAGPYLAEVHAADLLFIGHVTLIMALAMVAGNFIYGPLDTLFGTRKWVAFFGNLIAVFALVALALMPTSGIWTVSVLLAVIGVTGASYGLLLAHGRAFLPPEMVGRGVTLLNFVSIGSVGLMQFATGGVAAASAVPDDPARAYVVLFGFYAAMLAISLVFYLFARDAKPEKTQGRLLQR
jgi:sugar phosphate permease